MKMKMKTADQVCWALDDVSSRRKAVRRKTSIGDSGREENLGEAQAYCPRGIDNRMLKQVDLTSEVKRLRAPRRRHA
jgi:hypothetical protein